MAGFLILTFVDDAALVKKLLPAIADASGQGSTVLAASRFGTGEAPFVEDEFGVAESIDGLLSSFASEGSVILTAVNGEEIVEKIKSAVLSISGDTKSEAGVTMIVVPTTWTKGVS